MRKCTAKGDSYHDTKLDVDKGSSTKLYTCEGWISCSWTNWVWYYANNNCDLSNSSAMRFSKTTKYIVNYVVSYQ